MRAEDGQCAFRKLATLLVPYGRIAISLRLGEPDAERRQRVTFNKQGTEGQVSQTYISSPAPPSDLICVW